MSRKKKAYRPLDHSRAWTPQDVDRREKAIGLNPWGGYNHNALGCEFFQMRSWDSAITEFERAIEINPWAAYFKANLARACIAAGKFEKAEAAALAALAQNAALPGALFALGLLYETRRELKKAISLYRRCLAAKPSYLIKLDAEENLALLLKEL